MGSLKNELDIEFSHCSYDQYQYKNGDVVYCDPPYKGTGKYVYDKFDHDGFYEWVRTRDYPIWFSEYSAPSDFVSMFSIRKMKIMGGGRTAHNKAIEHLFIHEKFSKIFSQNTPSF